MENILKDMKDMNNSAPTAATTKHQIKPLKRALLNLHFDQNFEDLRDNRNKAVRRYRAQNPKWASLQYGVGCTETFADLDYLGKFTSLNLTSVGIYERQCGACVGHFTGDIKKLEKKSRYLTKLYFGSGVVQITNRRLANWRGYPRKSPVPQSCTFDHFKRWISNQKHLIKLAFVPYWFGVEEDEAEEDAFDEYEEDNIKTTGVANLLHLLHAQLKDLTLIGVLRDSFIDEINFTMMSNVRKFGIIAASRPRGCDGEPFEFGDQELKIIKKALKNKSFETLTLQNEYDITPEDFWSSLKKLILPVTTPLRINITIERMGLYGEIHKWLQQIFSKIKSNNKIRIYALCPSYSLSLPENVEVKGEDFEEYGYSREDQDNKDDEKDEEKGEEEGQGEDDNSGEDDDNN